MTDHLLVASGLTAGYDKTEILRALDPHHSPGQDHG